MLGARESKVNLCDVIIAAGPPALSGGLARRLAGAVSAAPLEARGEGGIWRCHNATDLRQLGPGAWQGNAVWGLPCSMQEQLQAQALIVCHNLPPRHSQLLAQPCRTGCHHQALI